jgi:hypothetical protein
MQKALIAAAPAILVAGLLGPWSSKLPLGRLPGDVASLIAWPFRR